jgi:crotonobetaine/carnitine-CoA ligase
MQTYPHFDPQLPKSMWVLPKILEMQATERRDKVYLTVPERGLAFTFGEMNALANRLARGLAAKAGVAKGDCVTLMMPNSPEFITAWFAAAKLGAVEAPINNTYKGSFLEHQVNIAGASVAVISHDQVPVWRESIERMPNMRAIIVWTGSDEPLGDCPIGGCRVIDYSDMFDDREDDLGIEVLPSDISSIIYTSGTTGLSKGVMMPHAQFYLFAESDIQLVKLRSDDIYMTSLPLFHGNAQFLTVYPTLITGSQCVLYSKFSASRWVDHLHESRATVTNTIGVILPFAAAQPPTDRDNTHSLERVLATPTPPDAAYVAAGRFQARRRLRPGSAAMVRHPHRRPGDGRGGAGRADGRAGRAPQAAMDAERRIYRHAREDGGGLQEPVVPHRRRDEAGRRRLVLLRRPHQGRAAAPGREHLLIRDRGAHAPAPDGRAGRRHRRPRRGGGRRG